jgi:hypothetical protein
MLANSLDGLQKILRSLGSLCLVTGPAADAEVFGGMVSPSSERHDVVNGAIITGR